MPVTIQMPSILRRKKRAVRMMATVVLLFAACWAPFHLVSLLLDYGTTKLLVLFPLGYCCQSPCCFSSSHKKYIFLSVSQLLSFLLEYSKNFLISDSHLLFHFPPPRPFIEVNTRSCEPSTYNRLFFYSSHSYPYGNYCEFVEVL